VHHLTAKRIVLCTLAAWPAGQTAPAKADIGELYVYSPVLEGAGIAEIEYRGARTFDSDPTKDDAQSQKMSFGYGITDWWFVEAYGELARDPGGSTHFDGTEWETIFQLTEPGEYWANVGLSAEYERVANRKTDSDELEFGPLLEHDFGPATMDLNLVLDRQLGPSISERGVGLAYRWETRWRLLPQLQPAIEAFGDFGPISRLNPGEQQHLLGPALAGKFLLGFIPGDIEYDVGYLFGLTPSSPAGTTKVIIEYEFPLQSLR
jgi:hypothetical protein